MSLNFNYYITDSFNKIKTTIMNAYRKFYKKKKPALISNPGRFFFNIHYKKLFKKNQ